MELLTSKEAAAFLTVNSIVLAKWRGQKKGPAWTQTGRTVKYQQRDLESSVRKNAVRND